MSYHSSQAVATAPAQLSLQDEEAQNLYQLNENWSLVDALSYIDPLTEDASVEAKRLIQQELLHMGVVGDDSSASSPSSSATPSTQNGDACTAVTDGVPASPVAPSSASSSSLTASRGSQPHIFAAAGLDDRLDGAPSSYSSPSTPCTSAKNYLKNFPLPATPTIDKLYEIYRSRPAAELHFDMTRYGDLEPPDASKASSITEWIRSTQKGQMLLEYSSNAVQNLELMQTYCQKAWLKQLADATVHETMLKRLVSQVRKEVEETNKKRKLEQVSCGNEMRNLIRAREDYIERNGRILTALRVLEKEVRDLKKTADGN